MEKLGFSEADKADQAERLETMLAKKNAQARKERAQLAGGHPVPEASIASYDDDRLKEIKKGAAQLAVKVARQAREKPAEHFVSLQSIAQRLCSDLDSVTQTELDDLRVLKNKAAYFRMIFPTQECWHSRYNEILHELSAEHELVLRVLQRPDADTTPGRPSPIAPPALAPQPDLKATPRPPNSSELARLAGFACSNPDNIFGLIPEWFPSGTVLSEAEGSKLKGCEKWLFSRLLSYNATWSSDMKLTATRLKEDVMSYRGNSAPGQDSSPQNHPSKDISPPKLQPPDFRGR